MKSARSTATSDPSSARWPLRRQSTICMAAASRCGATTSGSVDSPSRFREHVESFGHPRYGAVGLMSSNDIAPSSWPNQSCSAISGPRPAIIDDVCHIIRTRRVLRAFPRSSSNMNVSPASSAPSRRKTRRCVVQHGSPDAGVARIRRSPAGRSDPRGRVLERITLLLTRVVRLRRSTKVPPRRALRRNPGCPRGNGFMASGQPCWAASTVSSTLRPGISPTAPSTRPERLQGSVADIAERPASRASTVIRVRHAQGISHVHFRTSPRGYLNFQIPSSTPGNVDMLKAMRLLQICRLRLDEMPDQCPRCRRRPNGTQGFAFALGYIKAPHASVSSAGVPVPGCHGAGAVPVPRAGCQGAGC